MIRQRDLDFVTNLCPRSFPYGISVEVFRTASLQEGYMRMHGAAHHEHVTLFFYQNLDQYRFRNIHHNGEDLSQIRLTVDTEEDLKRFAYLYKQAGREWNSWRYTDFVAAYLDITDHRTPTTVSSQYLRINEVNDD
jgi:spore coat polysaccharide biosynthesis protein SpsF (cytidylyltransferase family)